MSYFTAVLTHERQDWSVHEVDLDDVTDLDDLTDRLRDVVPSGGSALAVLEHEDEWFALVRLQDGETGDEVGEDVSLFVSDLAAAQRSHYGDLVAPAAEVETELGEEPEDPPAEVTEPGSRFAGPARDAAAAAPTDDGAGDEPDQTSAGLAAWAGEPELLADLGLSRERLVEIAEAAVDDPDSALAGIGAACGFQDLLEGLR